MAAFPWVFLCSGSCLLTINIYCRTSSLCQRNTGQEKPFPLLPQELFSVSSLAPWKGVGCFKPKVKGNSVKSLRILRKSLGWGISSGRSSHASRGQPGAPSRLGASLVFLLPSNPSTSLLGPTDGLGFLALWLAVLQPHAHSQGDAPRTTERQVKSLVFHPLPTSRADM